MWQDIVNVIATVGFPISACVGMGYYVKYITEKYMNDIEELNESHNEEISSITQAIYNNTLALQRLTDKLGVE